MLHVRSEPERPDVSGLLPLVGRGEVVVRVADLLATSARAVVLSGVAGAGKTRVLSEVLRRTEERGVSVARVTATRSASSIPFGALASILPADELLADSLVGVVDRAARVITALAADRGSVVLAIDDANLLDDASAMLVHQLALDGSVRLLLAIRTGESLSAPLASVASDAGTEVVDIVELRRADVADLAVLTLGGTVDATVVQAIWDVSKGNPLYVRELLIAALEDGSVRLDDGVWTLTRRPTMPARLIELVEARLASVDEEGRAALELLAIAGTLGREAYESAVGTDVVSRLAQRGLVVAGRDARRQPVRVAHPLYEETLRRQLPARRLRQVQLRIAGIVEDAGMRRRSDRVVVTTLRLDAGGSLDVALLEAAALDAYFSLDVELTERLTRAGLAAGGSSRLRRMLGEILRYQGRFEEAETVLAGAPHSPDEGERTMTGVVRAEILFRGLGELDLSLRILRDLQQSATQQVWRDEAASMIATVTAFSGDVRTGLATAMPVIDAGPSRAAAAAATAAVTSLTFMGRADDAAVVAERAFEVASALGPQESQAVVAVHVVERVLALVESGRLAEAEMIGRMSYEWSLASGARLGVGWFALLLARAAQVGGRLDEAVARFRESALAFRDLRDDGIRRWALAGIAQTSAMLGRAPDAAMALDELDTAPPTAVHLLEAEVMRARAWTSAAQGASARARQQLLDAATWASARGQLGLELGVLHDLVRLGHVRDVAGRALAVAAEVQGPLAAARAAHVEGAHRRDGALLDDASEAFAAIAANLFAAEAAAQAAAAHRRDGRQSAAAASAARAEELSLRCEGASTPALRASAERGVDRLTPRELEIAQLAASGLSSRDIADALGVSVRTVDNQLQRTYTKLGISGRRQLADGLRGGPGR